MFKTYAKSGHLLHDLDDEFVQRVLTAYALLSDEMRQKSAQHVATHLAKRFLTAEPRKKRAKSRGRGTRANVPTTNIGSLILVIAAILGGLAALPNQTARASADIAVASANGIANVAVNGIGMVADAGKEALADVLKEEVEEDEEDNAASNNSIDVVAGAAAAAGAAGTAIQRAIKILNRTIISSSDCGLLKTCSAKQYHEHRLDQFRDKIEAISLQTQEPFIQRVILGKLTLSGLLANLEFLNNYNKEDLELSVKDEVGNICQNTGILTYVQDDVINSISHEIRRDVRTLTSAGRFDPKQIKEELRLIAEPYLRLFAENRLANHSSTSVQDLIELYVATVAEKIIHDVMLREDQAGLESRVTQTNPIVNEVTSQIIAHIDNLLPQDGKPVNDPQVELMTFRGKLRDKYGSVTSFATTVYNNARNLMDKIDEQSKSIFDDYTAAHNKDQFNAAVDFIKKYYSNWFQNNYQLGWSGLLFAIGHLGGFGGICLLTKKLYNRLCTPGSTSHGFSDFNGTYYYKPGKTTPNKRGTYAQFDNGHFREVNAFGQFSDKYPKNRSEYVMVLKNGDLWYFTLKDEEGNDKEYSLSPKFKPK